MAAVEDQLVAAGFDPNLPTYILSECVLVYLDPEVSRAIISWAAQKLSTAMFVIYEQIRPHDAFGRQMMTNLEARGCPLRGLPAVPSLEAQRQRFLNNGWPAAGAWAMDQIYRDCLDRDDKRRIEGLEIFDEFEEWHMIQSHYCIAVGIKDDQGRLAGLWGNNGGEVPKAALWPSAGG